MATSRTKKVTPEEVSAAYGEKITASDTEAKIISEMIDCSIHAPTDHKKATMQSLYGAQVVCATCGAKIKLGWVLSE